MPAVVKKHRKTRPICSLPEHLTVRLDKLAEQNERSRAAELRVAVKAHLAQHGK